MRLWALYEHVLRRLLRPHSREGESARGFEASSAVTGCFLLRAVFVEALKNEEDWRTRDEVRYSKLPPGGAIEGATVSYRRCHRRCDGAWRFRRCHRTFDVACQFRRCHRRCGGVIEGFDGIIEASSGVRVPPQVRAGSRKVRTDLARNFATAASIDQILFSIVVVSVSSHV